MFARVYQRRFSFRGFLEVFSLDWLLEYIEELLVQRVWFQISLFCLGLSVCWHCNSKPELCIGSSIWKVKLSNYVSLKCMKSTYIYVACFSEFKLCRDI